MTQLLKIGYPAPWFTSEYAGGAPFQFNQMAGKVVVVAFPGHIDGATGKPMVDALLEMAGLFAGRLISFFVIYHEQPETFPDPGAFPRNFSFIHDGTGDIARQFGCLEGNQLHLSAFVLDRRLRVFDVVAWVGESTMQKRKLADATAQMLEQQETGEAQLFAPVLRIPQVFDVDLCTQLVALHDSGTPQDAGFMLDSDGKTRQVINNALKQRSDQHISEGALLDACTERLRNCVYPELARAFQFKAQYCERHIVGCYDADRGGRFMAHRDNTTLGTAHRGFAVTIVLNSGEYTGGELMFPEYGTRQYQPDTGEALVFSCSLMHAVLPVKTGKRYVYLPFLYDEAGALIRERNRTALS